MTSELYYTPEHHIPAFLIIRPDNGEAIVEFLNQRTGKRDRIPISEFIRQLLKAIS